MASPVISIESCKELLCMKPYSESIFFSSKKAADFALQAKNTPKISDVSKQVFMNQSGGLPHKEAEKARKIKNLPDLPTRLKELENKFKNLEELSKNRSSNSDTSFICWGVFAYLVSSVALYQLSFQHWMLYTGALVLSFILGLERSLSTEAHISKDIDKVRKSIRDSYEWDQKEVATFEEFFKDKELIQKLEDKITEAINEAPEDSKRRQTLEGALREFLECKDFCTVLN